VKRKSGSAFLVNRSLILLFTFIIINVLLIIDTSMVRISTFTGGMYPLENYMILFILIYAAYATGNVIIIRLVSSHIHSASGGAKSLLLKSFFVGLTATQYVILFMIFILIFQILTNKFYSVWILKSISFNSYVMGGIMLCMLSYKLFSWYRRNKSVILILYFFVMSLICANSFLMVYTLQIQLASKPDKISYSRSLAGGFALGSGVFKLSQEYILIISFSILWLATALLMKSYTSMKGLVRYWAIMFISLIYFTGQFQPFFGIINLSAISTTLGDIGYTIFVSAAKPIAGILFGLVFWSISRKITKKVTKEYLLIAGFGMMLLFASNQSTGLALTPLPPFGIITAAFFGLSTYLLFIGLYSTAVSVSHDLTIRKQVRTYANELVLLDKMGTPEMKQQVESLVSRIMKDLKNNVHYLAESSGISPSIDEENFNEYLQMVIKEIKRGK